MDKIISLALEGKEFYGFIVTDDQYAAFRTAGSRVIRTSHYEKSEYKSYEHFVGVMSKFDPYTFFLAKPVPVIKLTRAALDELWEKIKK